jgi:hypothetical protein
VLLRGILSAPKLYGGVCWAYVVVNIHCGSFWASSGLVAPPTAERLRFFGFNSVIKLVTVRLPG